MRVIYTSKGMSKKFGVRVIYRKIRYLGHLLSARGISVLLERVAAIQIYPRPNNLRTLRRFVGMNGFYARFMTNYSKFAAALHALKRKGNQFCMEQ